MVTFEKDGYHYNRKANPESPLGLEGLSIRLCDLSDVCDIIAHKRYPNATFSDDECVAWEIVANCVRDLGIEI